MKQLSIGLKLWGGKRRGAGRKPRGAKAGVSHDARDVVNERVPVHVTLKLRRGLWRLRSARVAPRVMAAIGTAAQKHETFKISHFSVQDDHVHLLIEAADNRVLSTGVQGLSVRIARALNKLMGRAGRVFKDRFHSRALHTPRETRLALSYVLLNGRKHLQQAARTIAEGWIDPLSSAAAFDGWLRPIRARYEGPPLPKATSWLLTAGWQRGGLIDPHAVPANAR